MEPENKIHPTNAFVPWTKECTEHSIPYRFRQQARNHPDRTAVKSGDCELTYRALDRAASRLAQAILARRGEADEPVLLLVEHGAQMVVALLGVLKAAKFYAPLNPAYPHERCAYIANDLGAELIVTNSKNLRQAGRLVTDPNRVVNLDDLDPDGADEDPGLVTRPDSIAFVLHTSGSTGQPKGVIYTHRNVLHNVLRYTNGQHITPDDRLSLLLSYSYGYSIGNIFSGLLNGAAILTHDPKEDGLDRLARWLADEEITIFVSVSSFFRRFVGGLKRLERFPNLRLIRLGGEAVYRNDVEAYKRRFEETCLLHLGFGTTETGVVREHFLDKHTECETSIAPVGYAVDDMEVLILDDGGRAVGFDCAGEIAVRSHYLSPGYWLRPELTSASFLVDPEGGGRRIYRTGDVGSMRPDGCLMHLGRKDSQVKIRGYRVEVADVEAALHSVAGVREAVVTAREHQSGEKRLLSHVVLDQGAKLHTAELRFALRELLPDFMIPSSFVVLDELPRAPGGKVDHEQLRRLVPAAPGDQSTFVAPRGSVEARLAKIWERVLDARPVGVADDFFDLGGDSLAAVQLFDEIEVIFGSKLPASTLLQAPTIEQMAELLTAAETEPWALVAITVTGSAPPFFCAHGIGGDVISLHTLARHLGEDQPFYGLRAVDVDVDRFSVESIAAHYVTEIQRVQRDGPYLLGGYSFGGIVAFEMAHQLVAQGKTVGLLALFDTYGPGYPELLPVRMRLAFHLRHVLRAEAAERMKYLRERVEINLSRIGKSLRRAFYDYTMTTTGKPPATMVKNVEAAHEQAVRNYVRRSYSGRLDLFRAIDQREIWRPDPLLGWGGLADGGVRVHDVPGDHITLIGEPNVRTLAEKLSVCLRSV